MIKVYKTFELSDSDWKQIIDGFNESFGRNKSIEGMKQYYCCNVLGYSYHAIDFTEDGIVRGYNSIVPTQYEYEGQRIMVGISGGTYVNKEYRKDVFIFKHLMDALFEYCSEERMVMKVGVPNKNSFKYTLKINKAKLVGYLNYYILPIRLFHFTSYKSLYFLNFVSILFVRLHLLIVSLLSGLFNSKSPQKQLKMVCDSHFYDSRYRSRNCYKECAKGAMIGFYRICDEEGKKVAYLMDFKEKGEKTLKALLFLTRQIFRNENDIDAIVYIGTMNLSQPLLLKIPQKMIPKPLPLTINVINGDKKLEAVALDMNSWDFGLQNFDVR